MHFNSAVPAFVSFVLQCISSSSIHSHYCVHTIVIIRLEGNSGPELQVGNLNDIVHLAAQSTFCCNSADGNSILVGSGKNEA